MNIKYVKYIFFCVIVILTIIGIYVVYFKNINNKFQTLNNYKDVKISKTITIGITSFDTINPIITKNFEIQQITKLVYEPLVNITLDFNTQPGIANEWSKIDECTYLIKLDENKRWHDGERVTFEDIEFTLDKIKTEDSIYRENVQAIEKIEKIDENVFKIYLNKDVDFFEYILCFPIMQKKSYESKAPNGTGKYKIKEISNNRVIIKKDDQELEVYFFKNSTDLYNQFTRGNIDLLITKNINYEEYIGNIGFEENIIPGRELYFISCNNIENVEERKNIENLLNKQRLVYSLYNKKYIISEFPLDYGSYLNTEKNQENEVKLNTNKKYTLSTDFANINIANEIKANLEENGIKIDIVEYKTNITDLTLNVKTVSITPDISSYFEDEETKEKIYKISKIENKEILKKQYAEIINNFYDKKPFISLYFDSYIMLHSTKLKGKFSGNWYNMFYDVETWYKIL